MNPVQPPPHDLTDEPLFRGVFAAAPDALIVCSADGRIVRASDRCRDVFGYEPAEMVELRVEDLMPARFRTRHRRLLAGYAAAPRPRPMGETSDLVGLRKDGTEFPVEISLSPVTTRDGQHILAAVRDTTLRTEAQAAVARLAAIVESSDDAILGVTLDGIVTSWNAGAAEMYGYTADDVLGRHVSLLTATEAAAAEQKLILEEAGRGRPRRIETIRRRKDGRLLDVALRASPVRDRDGGIVGVSMIGRDITERNRLVRDLTLRARLLDLVDAAVIATDLSGVVIYWNHGAERLYGWRAEDVIGAPVDELTVGPQDGVLAAEVMREVAESGSWEGSFEVVRSDGSTFPAFVRDVLFSDEAGRPAGVIGVSIDITERVAAEQRLREARDFLTAVTENVGEALIVFDATGRITYVNGVASHLLGYDAEELHALDVTDLLGAGEPDRAATLDEVCPSHDVVRLSDRSMRCRDGSWLPVDLTSSPLRASKEPQWVMVVADDTERRAARTALQQELEKLGWVDRVQEALRAERLVLYAQPILDIATQTVSHHELLLRMRADDGSLIPPGRFLPVAEEHGLIVDIDRWVVDRGLALASAGARVAVNLSAATLSDRAARGWIIDRIAASGADPSHLTFEVTETAFLHDQEAASALASALAGLGCVVALDDFGTGYGGFTYLKHLAIGLLKIDMEFVRDVTTDEASRHVTQAIVQLGAAFGMKTVAEGVEDAATLEAVTALGVDLAQGFHIGRPMPASTVSELQA